VDGVNSLLCILEGASPRPPASLSSPDTVEARTAQTDRRALSHGFAAWRTALAVCKQVLEPTTRRSALRRNRWLISPAEGLHVEGCKRQNDSALPLMTRCPTVAPCCPHHAILDVAYPLHHTSRFLSSSLKSNTTR
jgi:hypothetical protein